MTPSPLLCTLIRSTRGIGGLVIRRFTAGTAIAGVVAAGLVVVVSPGPVAAVPTTQGLIVHYTFDSDTGTTARDASANRINGSYVNTTASAARASGPPGLGAAARFVGSSRQYVSVPERNILDVNRFTLAAWVNYTGVQNPHTIGRWEVLEKANSYWINIRTDGHVRVGGFFGGCANPSWRYVDSTVTVPTNTWTHVAGTYSGSALTVWVNGQRVGSRAISGRTCAMNGPLAIAAKNNPDKGLLEGFMDGRLDDVRIYNRALTGAEVRGLMS